MFNRILVPFDVQFIPKTALRAAAAFGNAGSELVLLHITDTAREFSAATFTVIDEDQVERYEARVKRAIGNVLAILSEYGATATSFVAQGRPVHAAINRAARDVLADAILMGTHGRRGLSRAFFGSVTEQVAREADVPVIAIRESTNEPFFQLYEEQPKRLRWY